MADGTESSPKQPYTPGAFNESSSLPPISFVAVGRTLAGAVGVGILGTGLWLTIKVFFVIFGALKDPQGARPVVEEWAQTLGGDGLMVEIAGTSLDVAKVLAAVLVGGAAFLLAFLALRIMVAGAKILQWVVSDRAALKRILREVRRDNRQASN